jgi:type VI secretion system secreted protein Hcp
MSDVDLFLKIDGIEGETQDSKHKGELQIKSFSEGVTNKITGASSDDAGLSTWRDADFTMSMDKGYPKLFQACVSGDRIKKAVLTFRKAGKGQQEFLKITFSDVLISHCRVEGKTNAAIVPSLSFSFNYAQIEEEYKVQKDDGSLSGAIKYTHSIPKAPQRQ